jgi:phosphoglucomutase
VRCLAAYHDWCHNPFFDVTIREELSGLTDVREIEDRFYRDLSFGTGGLRGIMGAGTNRMNKYVVRRATRGLADYLRTENGGGAAELGVVIAYDSRNHSAEFAMEAALTLCAAGIPAYLFSELAPTPMLSFAVPYLGCAAGVVITASHNPKEYNGYKVYNSLGCQLVPREAGALTRYIDLVTDLTAIPVLSETDARASRLLRMLDCEVETAYLDAVANQAHSLDVCVKSNLKIVYTPLHGTGNRPVRAILGRLGYTDLSVVPEQEEPNGDFPTVKSPNPEDKTALASGIEYARRKNADIVLGTSRLRSCWRRSKKLRKLYDADRQPDGRAAC